MLLDYPKHAGMQRYVAAVNALYKKEPALWERDTGWDGYQWLNVNDADRSSIAFLRKCDSGRDIVCAVNFTPVAYDEFVIGLPAPGTLTELLNSDAEEFGMLGANPPTGRFGVEGAEHEVIASIFLSDEGMGLQQTLSALHQAG